MRSSVDNVQIVPVNVLWKMEHAETLDFDGLASDDLDGTSLKLWTALDASIHGIWFDNGGAEPDLGDDVTMHAVDVSAATTPADIASAAQAIINAITGFVATVDDTIVKVKRSAVGETTESVDVDSDVVITLSRRGRDFDLGLLQGDIETGFQPENFIVNAHQTGKTPLAALSQGFSKLEVSTTLLETQKARLRELYTIYGGTETPDGGTEVYGVGSISQGKNMMVEAGRLVLKPVNAEDDTQNVNLMLAIPMPGSLVLSGENPRTLAVTWQGFIDRDFNEKFNALAIGDVFQADL